MAAGNERGPCWDVQPQFRCELSLELTAFEKDFSFMLREQSSGSLAPSLGTSLRWKRLCDRIKNRPSRRPH